MKSFKKCIGGVAIVALVAVCGMLAFAGCRAQGKAMDDDLLQRSDLRDAPGLYGSDGKIISEAGTTIDSALAWLKNNAASNEDYIIVLGEDVTVPTNGGYVIDKASVNNKSNVSLTIEGSSTAERTITAAGNQGKPLFTVDGADITLSLGKNLVLQGSKNNRERLVTAVNNARLQVDGATLQENAGGAIEVNGAKFGMTAGIIRNNGTDGTVIVNVDDDTMHTITNETFGVRYGGGILLMGLTAPCEISGGTITGNTAKDGGGGIFARIADGKYHDVVGYNDGDPIYGGKAFNLIIAGLTSITNNHAGTAGGIDCYTGKRATDEFNNKGQGLILSGGSIVIEGNTAHNAFNIQALPIDNTTASQIILDWEHGYAAGG